MTIIAMVAMAKTSAGVLVEMAAVMPMAAMMATTLVGVIGIANLKELVL